MPDAISIGPLAIPSQVIAALLALTTGAIVLRLIARNRPEMKVPLSALSDRVFTALLVAFVLWKLTPLVFWWQAILDEPLRLLRLPGGRPGLIAGTLAFLALLTPLLWKDRRLIRPVAVGVFTVIVSYAIAAAAISTLSATTAVPPAVTILTVEAPALNEAHDGIKPSQEPLLPGDRPAVVTFWATWCGPCHAEIPVKRKAFKQHGGSVRFVAVNMTHTESGAPEVLNYAKDNDLEYPIVLDRDGSISALFGVRGTPTTVVLTAEGEIVDRWMGPSELGRIRRAVAQAAEG